jgi:hypothetical protein
MHSSYQVKETSYADLSLSVHERIDDLNRRAYGLAPAVAESAMDSGCTDMTKASYEALTPRRQKAWDMIAEAYAWNAISDNEHGLAMAESAELNGPAYRVEYGEHGFGVYVEAPEPTAAGVDPWVRILTIKAIRDEHGDFPTQELEDEYYRLLGERYDADGTHGLREPKPAGRTDDDRCTTCHRSAHRPGMGSGSYHGHAYTAPQAPAAEYYVILTGYRAPANRPDARFAYQPGEAPRAFAEAVAMAASCAARGGAHRTFDVFHASTAGQDLIVTVNDAAELTWPRH